MLYFGGVDEKQIRDEGNRQSRIGVREKASRSDRLINNF